jgi:glycosyltransferase involved in cell wall biosynthesis
MNVLIVGNYNTGHFSPFVAEQMQAIKGHGIHVDTYGIVGKGLWGYLNNIKGLKQKIIEFKPDLIHAHYGLSGLCANLQRQTPVVTTYHGSDIHCGGWVLKLSQLAIKLSAYNIFISKKLKDLSGTHKSNVSILPCGIDIEAIHDIPREEAKRKMNRQNTFVLFSGSFTNDVKNPSLAKEAMKKVPEAELVELKGYTRQEVNLLMNAADCLLMTSYREGSPQVIKEAMACGTPIVSVDVGDVKDVISETEGCYIAERNSDDIADKIRMALSFKGKTKGRQRIIDLGLSNDLVAKRLLEIYKEVLKQ